MILKLLYFFFLAQVARRSYARGVRLTIEVSRAGRRVLPRRAWGRPFRAASRRRRAGLWRRRSRPLLDSNATNDAAALNATGIIRIP